MTISEIDPASGPDANYADVATWEAALGSGEQIASIWNTGDVGALTLNDADPSSILIRPRAGQQHNGTLASLSTSARALSQWTIIVNATIQGIAFAKATSGAPLQTNGTNAVGRTLVVDGCLISLTSAATQGMFIAVSSIVSSPHDLTATIRNCVIYSNGANSHNAFIGSSSRSGNTTSTTLLTLLLENNTLRMLGAQTGTSGINLGAIISGALTTGSATINVTARNNASFNFANCFAETETPLNGTAAVNWTASHNASSDSTGDNFGGSGHLVNQAAGDWFANVAADLRKRSASPGIRAGVAITSNPHDFRGLRREGRYDIGFDQRPTLGDVRQRRLLACRE